eukprot:COSAG04_NODE_3166_length_3098_cov_1.577526_5_plen_439_part_00
MSTRTGFEASFQGVIMAGGKGSRLAPLTDDEAQKAALLPVGNRALISYQLDFLQRAGVTDVIVVTSAAAAALIERAAEQHPTMRVSVEVAAEDVMGTADALRQIQPKLCASPSPRSPAPPPLRRSSPCAPVHSYTDFCVMSCDLLTEVPLGTVLDTHRAHGGALTALMVQQPPADDQKKKVKTEDFVVLDEDTGALLMVAQKAELEETLDMRRTLVEKYQRVSVRGDLHDVHCYVLAHWVLGLLQAKTEFRSIKAELLPYLLRKQYAMSAADRALFPPAAAAAAHPQHLALGMSSAVRPPAPPKPCATGKLRKTRQVWGATKLTVSWLAVLQEPRWLPGPEGVERLHCHSVVIDAATARCQRVNTLAAFTDANRTAAKAYRPDAEARAAEAKERAALPKRLIGSECIVGPGLKCSGDGEGQPLPATIPPSSARPNPDI